MLPPLAAVILAAGRSRRLRSRIPKPLHPVGGRPMLAHALATCAALEPELVVVVAPADPHPVANLARDLDSRVRIAVQTTPNGTAGAFLAAENLLEEFAGEVLVVFGDTPLLRPETLRNLRECRMRSGAAAAILAFEAEDPTGYGRVSLSAEGDVERIVEERDATPDERAVRLCAAGPITGDAARMLEAARASGTGNAAGERYLTEIPEILHRAGLSCRAWTGLREEALGANDRLELCEAERSFQARARRSAMEAGATLEDPDSVRLSWDTELEPDVTLGPHVSIGPGVRIRSGATVLPFSSLEGCDVGAGARVGPHARIRPGTTLGEGSRIGNYVEIKASRIGDGAKVNHLAYVGDATVGAGANVGAGVITCNYDGVDKHRTEIGDGAFVGSNCCLVAPVRIGKGAVVGAGSVITRDVEDGALAVERAQQVAYPGRAARRLSLRRGGA